MLAIAIPIGLLIGLALGALGGGGSILTVPALVYLLGQSPHSATTGSLLIVGVTASSGLGAHWRAGRVLVGQGLVFGALGVAGSYVGTRMSARVDPHLLLSAFAALMLVAGGAMLLRSRKRDDITEAPAEPQRLDAGHAFPSAAGPGGVALLASTDRVAASCPIPSPTRRFTACRALKVVTAATVVGLLTGFFGVGGGFVIVPALVLALGFDMPVAVGTSLLVIALNTAVALAARLGGHAQLDWPLLSLFTASAIAGSFTGSRVASKVDAAKLTLAFAVLLVGVAAYTAARSLPYLV